MKKSIKNEIIKFSVFTLVGVFFSIFLGSSFIIYFEKKNEARIQATELIVSSEKQIQKIITSLILPEQSSAIELFLNKIKKDEKLNSVHIVDKNSIQELNSKKCHENLKGIICLDVFRNNITTYAKINFVNFDYGYLRKNKLLSPLVSFNSDSQIFILIIVSILILVFVYLLYKIINFIDKKIRIPLSNISNYLKPILDGEKVNIQDEFDVIELNQILNDLKTLIQAHEKAMVQDELFKVAKRVSHDIRSPLIGLEILIEQIENIPHENKRLIEKSIEQIKVIANDLLDSNRKKTQERPESIAKIINDITYQKKIENNNIRFILNMPQNSNEIYPLTEPVRLKSILSNIINNSIEAITTINDIIINVEILNESLEIIVQDFGHGIHSSNLSKIGKEEFTTKNLGNGVGISSACEYINSINGSFNINSKINFGTTVTMNLPFFINPKIDTKNLYFIEKSSFIRAKH